MSEITGALSNFFGGSGGKLMQTGLTGAGEVGNLLSMIQQGQQYNKMKQFENMSPQALAARVNRATAPLSAGLTQGVTNAVNANAAERGLAEAPGIQGADLAQALAPYFLQNQNQAYDLVAQQFGMPVAARNMLSPSTDLSKAWAQLMSMWGKDPNRSGTAPSDPNAFMNLIWGQGGNATPNPGLTDTSVFPAEGATA